MGTTHTWSYLAIFAKISDLHIAKMLLDGAKLAYVVEDDFDNCLGHSNSDNESWYTAAKVIIQNEHWERARKLLVEAGLGKFLENYGLDSEAS